MAAITFEQALAKLSTEFENLVVAAYFAYCGSPLPKGSPSYSVALYRNIFFLHIDNRVVISIEDVQQELLSCWWIYYQRFASKQANTTTTLKDYLLFMSVRYISNWVRTFSWIRSTGEPPEEGSYEMEIDDSPYKDFRLDLRFLLRGTDIQPFSCLSSYERHLIYLKYKEEKNIDEIARLLQRDKHSISKHLNMVHEKLKEPC